MYQIDPTRARLIDPMNNPYFGTSTNIFGSAPSGNPNRQGYTQGAGNGAGVFDWSAIGGGGLGADGGAVDPGQAAAFLQSRGLRMFEQPDATGNILRYTLDASGNLVGEPQFFNTDDDAFMGATAAAMAITGANIYGAGLMGAGGAAGSTGGGGNALSAGVGGGGGGSAAGAGSAGAGGGGVAGGGIAGNGINFGAGGLNSLYTPTGFAGAGMGGGAGGVSGAIGAGGGGMSGGFLGLSPNTWANLGSTALGLFGQNQALNAQQNGLNQANEFNRYAFDTIRADNAPLVNMRNSVLPQIQNLLSNPGSIMDDPANKFQFAQGQRALNNGAAATGMTYSGAQGKALQRYGQEFASTKLDDSLRRLQSVAGLGQVGNNQTNQAVSNFAGNASGNALNMGSARSSAYGNMAGMANNALLNIFDQNQYRNINGGP